MHMITDPLLGRTLLVASSLSEEALLLRSCSLSDISPFASSSKVTLLVDADESRESTKTGGTTEGRLPKISLTLL